MNWLYLIAAGLASFRLTRLITDDTITSGLRRAVPKGKAKQGIRCPFCVSFWVSLGIGIALYLTDHADEQWLWIPAIWGLSVLFNQLFVRLSK